MIHSWFDSSSASKEGELLAQSFISEILRNAKNNRQVDAWPDAKQKLLGHAETASRDLGLNAYKKAKLVSVFKSKLVESKIDKIIVDETARVLLLHLWFGGHSEKASVSPTPGTVAQA